MPSKLEDVKRFFERIAILETKVESLMSYQKWQVGLLTAIFLLVISAFVKGN